MEDSEDNNSLISNIEKQLNKLKENIVFNSSSIQDLLNSLVELGFKKSSFFSGYYDSVVSLEGNSEDESYSIPNLFSGLKPTLNTLNLDSLRDFSDKMKREVGEFKEVEEKYGMTEITSLKTLKQLLSDVIEFSQLEKQLNELRYESLKSLNSPYDIFPT